MGLRAASNDAPKAPAAGVLYRVVRDHFETFRVLSLPLRLRYLLAWDHGLCRVVSKTFVRAVLGSLRRRARRTGVADGRSGVVAILQRFGAALNLNVHIHAVVLDGVYAEDFCVGRKPLNRPLGTLQRDAPRQIFLHASALPIRARKSLQLQNFSSRPASNPGSRRRNVLQK